MNGKTIAITDATFERQVLQAEKLIVVDFWAPWCAPCRAITPALAELAEAYADEVIIAKVDVDENPQSAARYNIMGMPTLVAFRDGQTVGRIEGARPKSFYQAYLDTLIQSVAERR